MVTDQNDYDAGGIDIRNNDEFDRFFCKASSKIIAY